MSKRTTQMVDRLCHVANWNSSLNTVLQLYADHGDDPKYPPAWKAEIEREIRTWTKKRNDALAKLKAIIAALTPAELDLVRRRYKPDQLRLQLAEVGAKASW